MPALPRVARDPNPHRDDRPALGRLPSGTATAGAVAVMLLAGAGGVAVFGGHPGRTAAAVARPAALIPSGAPTSSPALADPATVLPALRGVEPLLTAPPVTWQLFSGVALPYSPTAGPRTIDGPVYAGYQRSQTGALIAAAQLGIRYLLTPGQGWREVARRQLLPSAGRDAFVAARAGVDELTVPPGTYGQLAGFRVITYTPDAAVFALVSRFATTGMLQATTTTVKWFGGDWRLELQPDGGTSPTAQRVPNLDGFVLWGGA